MEKVRRMADELDEQDAVGAPGSMRRRSFLETMITDSYVLRSSTVKKKKKKKKRKS